MQRRLTLMHEVERERELLHSAVERDFEDPEGHLLEVYWPTGVPCRPRHGDPIDLTHSEEALRREVAEQAAG